MKNNHIYFLDYMRVFAFLSVLVGHKFFPYIANSASDSNHYSALSLIARGLIPFCWGGAAGVIVFFLTSGYIITHVIRGETSIEFLLKRIFRIYPLYIVAVLIETFLNKSVLGNSVPSLSIWVSRLLLVGDFFDTPYALAGVEWTLRIEVVFYVLMAVANIFIQPKKLVFVFMLCTALLDLIKPFPTFAQWSYGYLTLYSPFLFLGATIYLMERNLSNKTLCMLAVVSIYVSFRIKLSMIQPSWSGSVYPEVAIGLFMIAWKWKDCIPSCRVIHFFSRLTYSIYLFHNWMWHYLEMLLLKTEAVDHSVLLQLKILILLFGICYIVHHMIENKGIKLGSSILKNRRWKRHWAYSRSLLCHFIFIPMHFVRRILLVLVREYGLLLIFFRKQ